MHLTLRAFYDAAVSELMQSHHRRARLVSLNMTYLLNSSIPGARVLV